MKSESSQLAQSKQGNQIDLAVAVGLILSTLGLVLTMLGYGVCLAIETYFGAPHASMFDSTLELIDLSAIAVSEILSSGLKVLIDLTLFKRIYSDTWPALISSALAWLLLSGMPTALRKKLAESANAARLRISAIDKPSARLKRWSDNLLVLIGIAGAPFVFAIVALIAAIFSTVLASIPILGMIAGEAHFKDWVVSPDTCFPRRDRKKLLATNDRSDNRKPVPVVHCVAVTKDEKVLGKGRVVAMTFNAATLYDPDDGSVRRVPLADAVIEVVPDMLTNKKQ